MADRLEGTVKWFSRAKGFGFINPDGHEDDVFVHYSAIVGEGYRNLRRGQRVTFEIEDTPKGPQATDVIELEGQFVDLDALEASQREAEYFEHDEGDADEAFGHDEAVTQDEGDADEAFEHDEAVTQDEEDTDDDEGPAVLPGESLSGDRYT